MLKYVLKFIPGIKFIAESIKKNRGFMRNYLVFIKDFISFKKQTKKHKTFNPKWIDRKPITNEKTKMTSFSSHYIYHSGWAARVLAQTKPVKHIDISSTLYFNSIASAFLPIEFYDYRPANLKLDNLSCKKADLCKLFFETNSIKSLSCMHTVEHVGLGRYGDPVDPVADIGAMHELERVLAIDGDFLFVVPVGIEKIFFNAHRVYDVEKILKIFKRLKLVEFSLVTDSGDFIKDASINIANKQRLGCGMFWFKKIN